MLREFMKPKKSEKEEPAEEVVEVPAKPTKSSLPEDIKKLLEDVRDHGVAYAGVENLRKLEPYGWSGATSGPELKAWVEERLKA
jgi:hypothetical protein